MEICSATRADGRPCMTRALPGKEHCFAHDASLRERRRQGNAAGGRGKAQAQRAEKLVPQVLRPVLHQLLSGLVQVSDGRMTPRTGTALASISTAIVRVYEAGLLEERVRDLEQSHGRVG